MTDMRSILVVIGNSTNGYWLCDPGTEARKVGPFNTYALAAYHKHYGERPTQR